MPKPSKGPRLGGGPAHERLLLANLSAALFTHRSITTTEAKAKRLRPYAERLVTFAKRGDLHSRRRVMRVIRDKTVVHELFTEIAPLVADREGGYTRIVKTGFRKGDNAPMAVIELVLEPVKPKKGATAQTQKPAEPAGAEDAAAEEEKAEAGQAATTEGTDESPAAEEAPAAPAETDEDQLAESGAEPAEVSSGGTVSVEVPVNVPAESEEPEASSEEAAEATEGTAEATEDAAEATEDAAEEEPSEDAADDSAEESSEDEKSEK